MPRLPYFNPLAPSTNQKIQNRLDDRSYSEHRRRVKTATPAIDASPPHVYPHLSAKLKKLQLESERHVKILQDNIKILQRMSDILHSQGRFTFQQGRWTPNSSPNACKQVRPGEAGEKANLERRRRRRSSVVSWPHPLDIIIEELEEEFENKRLMLQHSFRVGRMPPQETKVCPRYVKEFGNVPGRHQPHLVRVPASSRRRGATALAHLSVKKSSSHSTCQACQEMNKTNAPPEGPPLSSTGVRKMVVSRPKAAAPHRRKSKETTAKEISEGVVLSHEFEKEFGDLLEKGKSRRPTTGTIQEENEA